MGQIDNQITNIIAFEKLKMHPLTFFMSYVLTPVYLIICLLSLGTFGVLMEIDEVAYLPYGLICLGVFVLVSALFLACVPFFRKRIIKSELERYDFNTYQIAEAELWDFSYDDISLKFDKNGMYVNDQLFYYNHLSKTIVTDNHCKRIGIFLRFDMSDCVCVTLSVTPYTLKMIECLEIEFDNIHVLEYIIANKEVAFTQIYNKGHVTTHS